MILLDTAGQTENKETGSDRLTITMLGRFSMMWNDENLASGAKTADSQFARLMQILLHNKETGVSRTELQELLFNDSKAEDVHHLLRTDIYNVRKRLREAGLPGNRFIIYNKGRYYWSDEIEVFEDARYFEMLYEKALEEDDPDKRCDILLEACYCYEGEFLPMQTGLLWVANEEKRYREMFIDCTETAAKILRGKNRYQDLEALGRHAVTVCPLRELEVLEVESLVSMGHLAEAYEIYDRALQYYQDEIGPEGAQSLMEGMEQVISCANKHAASMLDDIQAQLEESETGAFICSYPAFQSIYRTTRRLLERSDKTGYLMGFGVKNMPAAGAYSEEEMDRLSEDMGRVICESVRKGDIVCQYAKAQYLLMLLSKTNGGCRIAGERIKENLRRKISGYEFEFGVKPIHSYNEECEEAHDEMHEGKKPEEV